MEKSKLNNSLRKLSNLREQLTGNTKEKKVENLKPVRLLITGAVGNIGYALSFMAAQGRALGQNQPLILHCFDLPMFSEALKALEMELNDGAFDLLKGVVATVDPKEAFENIDYAILCGAKPRGKGMERKDLLSQNGKIFEEQGKYFERYAKRSVKVVVVGNPANTNALMLIKNAPSIDPRNFTALTRLDHNRLISQVSTRLQVDSNKIKNVIIWGNHSSTQYPYLDYAVYETDDNYLPLAGLINDQEYVETALIKKVQQRGAEIIKARKMSSAASAASSACDHMRDWVLGTSEGSWVSMAVYSNGEYGAPKDIVFSFPVHCQNGEWKIVEGLKLSNFGKKKIEITGNELLDEKRMALGL